MVNFLTETMVFVINKMVFSWSIMNNQKGVIVHTYCLGDKLIGEDA